MKVNGKIDMNDGVRTVPILEGIKVDDSGKLPYFSQSSSSSLITVSFFLEDIEEREFTASVLPR